MMVRYFLLAILVAVAAAQNENTQNGDEQVSNADATLYKQLKLTAEQIKAVNAAENQTAHYMAYMHALGVKKDTSCAGLFIDAKNIKFTLFSMPSQQIIWTADETNKNLAPYFDVNLPTQILIHGRGEVPEIFKPAELAFTYGVRGNKMNLITVDWSAYSDCSYIWSVFFTIPQLSTIISDMMKNTLVASSGANYDQMRLTGHGMGAHAAGLTARKLPQQISRITALDPAGRLYDLLPEEMRLKKGDARFLDVIMTNRGGYGLKDLIGDINFLPSGGRIQKPCLQEPDSIKDACSHEIAVEYFLESVDKGVGGFLAKNADSWAAFIAKKSTTKFSEVMGENVSQKRFGNYYLDVNHKKPYSKSVIGAYMVSTNGLEKTD